ncbi:hypothetical protein JKF63_03002 [Porcisia hertigi]|uniref:RRM domain-containing protein n=1 Tax=Porcisia hertigi TaxID=2761500 RepID=A0A836HWA9_9TRYP|nr:hypothetical protein JKF63_03002 [Porcisia hertigi]
MTSLQNLFVAKLPRNLTDADLEQIFVEYNPTSAKVMLDTTTGKSKGFGFVLFGSEEAGRRAYENLNKTHVALHGHNFNLCIFPSKHDGKMATEESNALYVRNIPLKLSQLEVEQFLRRFGLLTYCAMREDNFGGNVWVVYAEFDTVESAKSALTSLHGNRSYFNTSVAILAKYADSEEAKRERRRRREQLQADQQHIEATNNTKSPANGTGSTKGFAYHGHSAPAAPPPPPPPPPPMHTSTHTSQKSKAIPHSYSTPEMHMGGVGASLHPPPFASTSHHFSHGRCSGAPPPSGLGKPAAPPASLILAQSTPHQPLPTQGTLSQPQQPRTPSSVGSFLNVSFNPTTANNLGSNFTHFGCLEHTPTRSSPPTPLNFSFGPEMENCGALPNGPPSGTTAMLDVSGHAPVTPVRRNSNLSTSGSYRHNPYAPVTPLSSARNSTGPSTPIVSSIAYPAAPHGNMHFGASHHLQGSLVGSYPPGHAMCTTSSHFARRGSNAYLAAPSSSNDPK